MGHAARTRRVIALLERKKRAGLLGKERMRVGITARHADAAPRLARGMLPERRWRHPSTIDVCVSPPGAYPYDATGEDDTILNALNWVAASPWDRFSSGVIQIHTALRPNRDSLTDAVINSSFRVELKKFVASEGWDEWRSFAALLQSSILQNSCTLEEELAGYVGGRDDGAGGAFLHELRDGVTGWPGKVAFDSSGVLALTHALTRRGMQALWAEVIDKFAYADVVAQLDDARAIRALLTQLQRALLERIVVHIARSTKQRVCTRRALTVRDRIFAFELWAGNPPPLSFTVGHTQEMSPCELTTRSHDGPDRRRALTARLSDRRKHGSTPARRTAGVVDHALVDCGERARGRRSDWQLAGCCGRAPRYTDRREMVCHL